MQIQDRDGHVRRLTEEQVAAYQADTRTQDIKARAVAAHEASETHVKELTAKFVEDKTTQKIFTSETARNLLKVATFEHGEPVARARALKELNRFRGEFEVDAFFDQHEKAERERLVRLRVAALKQGGFVKPAGGDDVPRN